MENDQMGTPSEQDDPIELYDRRHGKDVPVTRPNPPLESPPQEVPFRLTNG